MGQRMGHHVRQCVGQCGAAQGGGWGRTWQGSAGHSATCQRPAAAPTGHGPPWRTPGCPYQCTAAKGALSPPPSCMEMGQRGVTGQRGAGGQRGVGSAWVVPPGQRGTALLPDGTGGCSWAEWLLRDGGDLQRTELPRGHQLDDERHKELWEERSHLWAVLQVLQELMQRRGCLRKAPGPRSALSCSPGLGGGGRECSRETLKLTARVRVPISVSWPSGAISSRCSSSCTIFGTTSTEDSANSHSSHVSLQHRAILSGNLSKSGVGVPLCVGWGSFYEWGEGLSRCGLRIPLRIG